MRTQYDWTLGAHEILCSGSVGSAKTINSAHHGILHCMKWPGARLMLGRRALPDLRDTIFQDVLDHLDGIDSLKEGEDWGYNSSTCYVWFRNGSDMISRSWADKRYKKLRSLKLSAAIIEELTENEGDDWQAITELKMRLGRRPGIPENWIIYNTNPDSPAHPAYKYFIGSKLPTRHVFYSRTIDNPFLPSWYIDQLRQDLDPKMAMRMIDGEWIEIAGEVVYYQYSREKNFVDGPYEINPRYPVRISWDFNIGEGKPMSACLFQVINGVFHFFAEVIIEGARTEDTCEEMAKRGYLEHDTVYYLHGDQTGGHKDTRQNRSDWEIITQFFDRYKKKNGQRIRYLKKVPSRNPDVRKRHNKVNAHMLNSMGQVRLKVYSAASTLDEGFRLVKLKKGSLYQEDDSKYYQHVTTAAGYGICYHDMYEQISGPSVTMIKR